MAKGKPGADSSVLVTSQIMGASLIELAKSLYGEPPAFWGRYFTNASSNGNVEYRHLKENQALREDNIRVLPIARQTKNVNGSQADGSRDATNNSDDIISTFGVNYLASLSGEFYVFLDIEGSPSLSAAYYTGWAQTLSAHSFSMTGGLVRLLPCVYATRADSDTWSALSGAVSSGVDCRGAWVARWPISGCRGLPEWSDDAIKPPIPSNLPVLIWQYADDCHGSGGFDCSETNPSIDQQAFLDRLILPPDMTALRGE